MKRLMFPITAVAILLSACAPAVSGNERTMQGMSFQIITASQLETMVENKDFLLVNVHVPYAGEIPDTDLFLPYNQIDQNLSKLPRDKSARIVVYCQAGMMSDSAARTLSGLGYTNIIDVDGGMIAWQKAGYQITRSHNEDKP